MKYRYFIAVASLIIFMFGWTWWTMRINFNERKDLYQECLKTVKEIEVARGDRIGSSWLKCDMP